LIFFFCFRFFLKEEFSGGNSTLLTELKKNRMERKKKNWKFMKVVFTMQQKHCLGTECKRLNWVRLNLNNFVEKKCFLLRNVEVPRWFVYGMIDKSYASLTKNTLVEVWWNNLLIFLAMNFLDCKTERLVSCKNG